MITIRLNGFVRRTQNTEELKAAITSVGATLKRKGRSRNWLLNASREQLQQIILLINQSEQESWLWIVKSIRENRPPLTRQELLDIVKENPHMTVSQLVSLTDCQLSEARKVFDAVAWG